MFSDKPLVRRHHLERRWEVVRLLRAWAPLCLPRERDELVRVQERRRDLLCRWVLPLQLFGLWCLWQ